MAMRTGAARAPEGMVRGGLPAPVPATKQPPGPHCVAQPPEEESQVSVALWQVSGPPPAHRPALQELPLVQASPSSQEVPSATGVVPQLPSGLQTPTVQGLPVSAGHCTPVPAQTPFVQESAEVQAFPSLQAVAVGPVAAPPGPLALPAA